MEQLVKKFEESVRQGLIKAGVSSFENLVIGAAVSGGADSIAMLTSIGLTSTKYLTNSTL